MMSANSNNADDVVNNEGQVVAVDQSSALQVETLGTGLAIEGLQEQIASGDQSRVTADTQQADSSDDMDDDESSSNKDESEDSQVVFPIPAIRAEELCGSSRDDLRNPPVQVRRATIPLFDHVSRALLRRRRYLTLWRVSTSTEGLYPGALFS
jgi:hypothetical protein